MNVDSNRDSSSSGPAPFRIWLPDLCLSLAATIDAKRGMLRTQDAQLGMLTLLSWAAVKQRSDEVAYRMPYQTAGSLLKNNRISDLDR